MADDRPLFTDLVYSLLYGVSFKKFYKIFNSPNVFLTKTDVEHVVFLRSGMGILFVFFIFIFVFTEELIIILNLIETLEQTLLKGLNQMVHVY